MEVPEEFKDFNIGKDPDLEDGIGQANQYPIIYTGYQTCIIAPGKAIRVRKDVSTATLDSVSGLAIAFIIIINQEDSLRTLG